MTWEQDLREIYGGDRFYKEVFDEKTYIKAKRGDSKIVLDVGACGGEFSYWMYHNSEKIYAIEPEPNCYKEIVDFVEKHHLDKIIPCNIALSDHDGVEKLALGIRGGHTLGSSNNDIEVKTQTLASFMKEHAIDSVDILKIDIESAEYKVFGANDFPEVAPKIKFIIGEHGVGNEFLLKNGFKITNYEKMVNFTAERI